MDSEIIPELQGLDSKAAEDLDPKQQRMDEEETNTMGTGEESWKEDEEEDLESFKKRAREAADRDRVFYDCPPEVFDRWMKEFGYRFPLFNQSDSEAEDLFPDSDDEENLLPAKDHLLPAEESSSEDDDDLIVQDEEEEEEEEDWKKGKTKEEQVQFLIDTYQNKTFFKSDGDDLSEDEDGCHEMTYQEFVRYTFELEESGGFDIGSYPKVFAFGMVKPYYEAPREKEKQKVDEHNDKLEKEKQKVDEHNDKLDRLQLFSNKALDKYNNKKGTLFKNVRVLKANSRLVAGYLYYITFEAFDDVGGRTFQAKVWEKLPKAGRTPRVKVLIIRPSRGNNG